MARLRQVKEWGNSLVIVLLSADVNDLGIKKGDMVDLEDLVIKRSDKNGKKK